jgi:hypothetical protein
VVTSGDYVDLTGEPAIAAPPQFDYSNAATTAEFAQRALGSFSGHAIQRADAAAGILQTHAPTATPTGDDLMKHKIETRAMPTCTRSSTATR